MWVTILVNLSLFSRTFFKGYILLILATFPLLSNADTNTNAEPSDIKNFERRIYIGAGIGLSLMKPDTDGTSYSIDNNIDFGYKMYVGRDLSNYFSAELTFADLGQTTLKPSGTIDYGVTAFNLLYYFYEQGKRDHVGWSPYIKGGLATLNNSATVPYVQNHGAQVSLGLGAEYGWENGIAARIDVESYDKDAALITVGLLYRFGQQDKKPQPKDTDGDGVYDDLDQCPGTPAATIVDSVGCELVSDKDGDGVKDEIDLCPNTIKGADVNNVGCAIFETKIDGVNFKINSADLTDESKVILDQTADELLKFMTVRVEIQAHTDSQGNEAYNLSLSEKRAKSVADYMTSKGIDAERMEVKGYGETLPIADNKTKDGRAQNRRVEFRVLETGKAI